MGRSAKAGAPAALEVEVVPTDALTLDPRNARKHGRRNLAAITASLEQFGQRRPLVVRADLQVIAGNGTLEAIRDLRWSEVAVTRVPGDWTDDQVRAYALADNRTAELAEWDDTAGRVALDSVTRSLGDEPLVMLLSVPSAACVA